MYLFGAVTNKKLSAYILVVLIVTWNSVDDLFKVRKYFYLIGFDKYEVQLFSSLNVYVIV